MARTAIVPQTMAPTGFVPSFAPANAVGGASIPGDGKTVIHVKNASASPINVTIQTPVQVDGLAVEERVVAVANGAEKIIGPFNANYNQADGTVYVDYSAVTSVTVAAYQIP